MFIATKQEMVSEAQTRAFDAPDTDFHNGLGAATKCRETTQNTSFRCKVCGANPNGRCRAPKWCENIQTVSFVPKGCIQICQVVCLESYYSETFNQMHANTSFRNGSGASTKLRETLKT